MKTLLVSLLAAASLTACATATNRMNDVDRLAMYQAHAGDPVKHIRYYDPIGWEAVDDSHALLNMRPNESWLLSLSGNCLAWGTGSPFLSLSSQTGLVMAKFDKVTIQGSPVSCRIEEIRPVDVKALRAAQAYAAAQGSAGT